MRKVRILTISLIAVLVLLVSMCAVACGGGVEEDEGEAAPEPMPPQPGEWTATTDFGELGFTVSPDSTGITKISFNFAEFECGGTQVSGGMSVENPSLWPITDGQFTVDAFISIGEVVIEGEFDQDGTYASGTWEISVCSGSWESSRGS